MFHQISWQAYFQWMFYAVLAYYTAVFLLYYRKDLPTIIKMLQAQLMRRHFPEPLPTLAKDSAKSQPAEHSQLPSRMDDLLEQITGLCREAKTRQFQKEELITALQIKLRQHAPMKGTPLGMAIVQHIVQLVKSETGIELEAADVKQLWMPVSKMWEKQEQQG